MSVQEFVLARKGYREELARHEAELMNRLHTMEDILWERPFNDAEKKQREAMVDELTKISRQQFFLAEADIRELNNQSKVQELVNHFSNLKQELKDKQQNLENLVGHFETATKVIQAVEQMVQKLGSMVAS